VPLDSGTNVNFLRGVWVPVTSPAVVTFLSALDTPTDLSDRGKPSVDDMTVGTFSGHELTLLREIEVGIDLHDQETIDDVANLNHAAFSTSLADQ
jgi:hypothetical protein